MKLYDGLRHIFRKAARLQITIKMPAALPLLLLYSLALTLLVFLIQPTGLPDIWQTFRQTGFLNYALNWLPIALVSYVLYFALGNIVLSAGITGLAVLLLSIINRVKLFMRHDPLLPLDFALVTEVAEILNNTSPFILIGGGLGVLAGISLILLATHFIKTPKMHVLLRVLPPVVLALIAMPLNQKVYASDDIYNMLYVQGNIYNQADCYNSKGFLYAFIYTANTNHIRPIDGYDKTIYQALSAPRPEEAARVQARENPHIFFIMSEAFSEIGDSPAIDYTGHTDPLAAFKEIRAEAALYGHLVAPALGGGTADTEFDSLTGINTRFFRGVPYSYRLVNRDMNSLARQLGLAGYENTATHPGQPWFYNRANVFEFFGFTDTTFIDAFPDKEMFKSMYVREDYCFDTIIDKYEAHIAAKSTPFFNFAVTIQNHGPYADKYAAGTNFATDLDLTAEDINALSNYFVGLADADREIKRLIDYAAASAEPIVVVFFGDHLPHFAANVYEKLVDGTASEWAQMTNRFSVPYIIWQNDASRKTNDFTARVPALELPANGRVSSFYLYHILLHLLDMQGLEAYTEHGLALLKDFPILMESFSFDTEGVGHHGVFNARIREYLGWQYYRIMDEK